MSDANNAINPALENDQKFSESTFDETSVVELDTVGNVE